MVITKMFKQSFLMSLLSNFVFGDVGQGLKLKKHRNSRKVYFTGFILYLRNTQEIHIKLHHGVLKKTMSDA